jgi:hypothetical protein
MVDENQPEQTRIKITALRVSPSQPGNNGWNNKGHGDKKPKVIPVLPPDNIVPGEITDICYARLAARFDDHPADMRPQKAAVSVVRIKICVSVAMVCTVTPRPPFNGTLDCACADRSEEVLQWF